jgi:maltooligosyltrehalose trehalohydrolase
MSINVSRRSAGINFNEEGKADIIVWAPLAEKVEVVLMAGENTSHGSIPLIKKQYGYWRAITDQIKPGSAYKISVDGKQAFPDPASLSQPSGVHDESVAIDLNNFKWTDSNWRNPALHQYIIYELHTGTFTPQHNFEGIKNKLSYLAELGITAIEIMPVGQFAGSRNWGYDGVYPFAVQDSYGGAAALQDLVNACHEKGIAVILDVIYNHIGPEGNYLSQFGPYFTDKYNTPWGKALNFDDAWCDGVREYFIDNALMWFRDFHIDALRMDAVHAIKDLSPVHLIKAIRQKTNELSAITSRSYYLITEMDLNDPLYIDPIEKGGYGADGQWVDEFHHALRVSSGQNREGYYTDFNGIGHLAKSYRDAYVYDGQFSEHRKKFFGAKTNNLGDQFVVFSQNHDHTGNRMMGERTSTLVSFEMCKLMAAAVMVSPYLPMLFMGEEWAEPNPFLFFISHTDKELAAIVNKGRKEEFSTFNWAGEPPDPRLEDTFNQSMLQWELLNKQPHRQMLDYYKKLIQLRKSKNALNSADRKKIIVEEDEEMKTISLFRWDGDQKIICLMNFSNKELSLEIKEGSWMKILDSASPEYNGPVDSMDNIHGPGSITLQPESILIYQNKEE